MATFTPGTRVSVGFPFRMNRVTAPDGYEGIWYVAKQEEDDLLVSRNRQNAVEGEGEVWIHISRCSRH